MGVQRKDLCTACAAISDLSLYAVNCTHDAKCSACGLAGRVTEYMDKDDRARFNAEGRKKAEEMRKGNHED